MERRVRRYVQANAVPCIRRALVRQGPARLVLVRDFRLRDRAVLVAVLAGLPAVRDNAMFPAA